jgi:predicted nucleic acid-binding protein
VTALVDTDRVADWLRGRPAAVRLLEALEPDGLAISLVTYGEIYEGIYFGRDPAGSERVFREFLRAVDVISLTRPIMRRFARLRGDLRRRDQLLGDPDLLLAATALHHDLTLVTGNRGHFQRAPDLRMYPTGQRHRPLAIGQPRTSRKSSADRRSVSRRSFGAGSAAVRLASGVSSLRP